MPVRALARVDLGAIAGNVRRLSSLASVCAVVKADGYGHGAVAAARAALAGGARGLAVATAGEAAELRAAGIESDILVMGALSDVELEVALAACADIVAWREPFVAQLAAAAAALRTDIDAAGNGGADLPAAIRVHVKLDTGMGRLGTRDTDEATRVAELVAATPGLALIGAMTHFATADDDPAFMREQLARFLPWADALRERFPGVIRHAANSAATLSEPAARLDMVRCGIAIYGMDPFQRDPAEHGLVPALELVSYVAEVKPARAGESAGYGRRFIAERDTFLATIPIGYGDGLRRGLTNRIDVLVGGRRLPIAGTVSMDNITVDLGPDDPVEVGTEVVLLGERGGERILAEDWARALDTINYEITCGLTPRVPREPKEGQTP
jgi:alanine racemase